MHMFRWRKSKGETKAEEHACGFVFKSSKTLVKNKQTINFSGNMHSCFFKGHSSCKLAESKGRKNHKPVDSSVMSAKMEASQGTLLDEGFKVSERERRSSKTRDRGADKFWASFNEIETFFVFNRGSLLESIHSMRVYFSLYSIADHYQYQSIQFWYQQHFCQYQQNKNVLLSMLSLNET